MTDTDLYNLKFPIGQFIVPDKITQEQIEQWIVVMEEFPKLLKGISSGVER